MPTLNLSFPLQSYSSSNKPSITTLKDDLTAIQTAVNALGNVNIASNAAIAYSKLNLAASIVNADVAPAAGIVYSKLNLAASIVNADVATNAAIVESKLAFDTSAGHRHDGSDSRLLYPGANYVKHGSAPIAQAQSTTVSRFTISGIANEDAGVINVVIGGNVGGIDRASQNISFSFYKTGGTVNFSAAATYGATGGATAAYLSVTLTNAAGDIVVQSVTGGFGAGNFIGNIFLTIIKNTAGAVVSL